MKGVRKQFFSSLGVIAVLAVSVAWWKNEQRLGEVGVKFVPIEGSANVKVVFPDQVPPYEYIEGTVSDVVLETLPPDTSYGKGQYQRKHPRTGQLTEIIDLNVVLMGTDRTSIHKPEICLSGGGWKLQEPKLVTTSILGETPYDLEMMSIVADKDIVNSKTGDITPVRAVMLYWFVADDQVTALHGERMWSMAKNLLTAGELQRWAYVTAINYCAAGQETIALESLQRFLGIVVPQFQETPEYALKDLPGE